jgi:YVTN family beta-propeller protein
MLSSLLENLKRMTILTIAVTPTFASVAYISNCCNHPSTVSVFQTSNGAHTTDWTVGLDAYGAVYSQDGKTAYISNTNSQSISVVDTATGTVKATVSTGFNEQQLAISADGTRLYAASFEYAYVSHFVAIDTATNTVVNSLQFSGILEGLAASPDGTKVYTSVLSGSPYVGVVAIDTTSFKITPVNSALGTDVALTPDGKQLWVPFTNGGVGTVVVINSSNNQVITTIQLPSNVFPNFVKITPDGTEAWVTASQNGAAIVTISASTFQTHTVGLSGVTAPGRILFSQDSRNAYIVDFPVAVDIFSVATATLSNRIPSAGIVNQPALSPDGTTMAVPNSGTAHAAAIDASGGNSLASVPIGAIDNGNQLFLEWGGVAVSPDGARAYATNYASGNVSVIDTSSKTVVTSVPVGASPVAVAVAPNNSEIYVANSFSDSVTIINAQNFQTNTIALPKSGYPSSIAVAPDGKHVYVAVNNLQPDFGIALCWILGIDTSSRQVASATRVSFPMALTVSPDGTAIYFIGGKSDMLYSISTATNQIVKVTPLATSGPIQPVTGGIAVTPDGTKVFAADGVSPAVYEVDLTSRRSVKTIHAGQQAGNIAITPDGTQVWVTDYKGTAVNVINIASGSVTGSIPLNNQSYGIAFGPQ